MRVVVNGGGKVGSFVAAAIVKNDHDVTLIERRAEVSEKVVSNVKEQIVPCIEELKKGPLTSKQKATLALLESNLTNIISPFTHRITSGIFNLTPKEIRVANLITQDKSTREIAELMNVSKKAVEFHRNNIRAKLGIRNSKTNLRTYLMTL